MIYKCAYCGKEYGEVEDALKCETACREKVEKEADEAAAEARNNLTKVEEIKRLLKIKETEINKTKAELKEIYEAYKNKTNSLILHKNDVRSLTDEFATLCPNCHIKITDNSDGYKVEIQDCTSKTSHEDTEPTAKTYNLFNILRELF